MRTYSRWVKDMCNNERVISIRRKYFNLYKFSFEMSVTKTVSNHVHPASHSLKHNIIDINNYENFLCLMCLEKYGMIKKTPLLAKSITIWDYQIKDGEIVKPYKPCFSLRTIPSFPWAAKPGGYALWTPLDSYGQCIFTSSWCKSLL